MLPDLEKENHIGDLAEKALGDKKILSELMKDILSEKEKIRFNSFKVLNRVSEIEPEALYPEWKFFENLLESENVYLRSIAVRIIANLAKVDKQDRFNRIFDTYYDLLNDSIIIARNVATNSGKIARYKPKIQIAITKKLLNIDKTSQKHKDLLKGDAIEAFDQYFKEAENKKTILEFAREQLNCESPRTRKKAKEFLEKWIT